MKSLTIILMALALSLFDARAAAPSLGYPNLMFRNKTTGENKVWSMSGTNFLGEQALPQRVNDPEWKIVGAGDFDADGVKDIVWNAPVFGVSAVWLMNSDLTLKSSVSLLSSPSSPNWDLVGVGDFDHDSGSKPDLLFHNRATGTNVIWIMNGTTRTADLGIYAYPDTHWQVYTIGDMGSYNPSTDTVNPTPDGNLDIIYQHDTLGTAGIQYMNGTNTVGFKASNGSWGSWRDFILCAAGDYTGNAGGSPDGKTDLVWRHATLGVNEIWPMQGATLPSNAYIPYIKHLFNCDWKMQSQSVAESNWKVVQYQTTPGTQWLKMSTLPAYHDAYLQFDLGVTPGTTTCQRRDLDTDSVTQWTTVGQNLTYSCDDPNIVSGHRYEYRLYQPNGYPGKALGEKIVRGTAGFGIPETRLENRGTVLVLVDQSLVNSIILEVEDFCQDLRHDGWRVIQTTAARHDDTTLSNNKTAVQNTKSLIGSYVSAYSDLSSVILIGHVAVPYTGTEPSDGHTASIGPEDHTGAWPCDMYYADFASVNYWTDTATVSNITFPECVNAPCDGKFDQNNLPNVNYKLAVGRIDFAKLPVFTDGSNSSRPAGISAVSEVELLQRYLTKDHQFRTKTLSWQSQNAEQAMVYGHFEDSRDTGTYKVAVTEGFNMFGDSNLKVGDILFPQPRPYLWGFQSGPGRMSLINDGDIAFVHTSAMFTDPANEGSAAFYGLFGSYFPDWNSSNDNLLRSVTATPNFGLAAISFYGADFLLDEMSLGGDLGQALVRTINEDPVEASNMGYSRQLRMMAIMGDPTLRLHPMTPPSNVSGSRNGNSVQLSWTASPDATGYIVYRAATSTGPFQNAQRISGSAPLSTTSFTDNSATTSQKYYLVRGLQLKTAPNGTYTNLSQGVLRVVQ